MQLSPHARAMSNVQFRRATMTPVASFAQWVEGARPRTLPNAIAPVIAGTGARLHAAVWWKALLALAVAVAMIIGVNYANDYSTASAAPTTCGPGRCGSSDHVWPHRVPC